MQISLNINGKQIQWDAAPGDTLLTVLRREGFLAQNPAVVRTGNAAPVQFCWMGSLSILVPCWQPRQMAIL